MERIRSREDIVLGLRSTEELSGETLEGEHEQRHRYVGVHK